MNRYDAEELKPILRIVVSDSSLDAVGMALASVAITEDEHLLPGAQAEWDEIVISRK